MPRTEATLRTPVGKPSAQVRFRDILIWEQRGCLFRLPKEPREPLGPEIWAARVDGGAEERGVIVILVGIKEVVTDLGYSAEQADLMPS
jgi:hypothetical protein